MHWGNMHKLLYGKMHRKAHTLENNIWTSRKILWKNTLKHSYRNIIRKSLYLIGTKDEKRIQNGLGNSESFSVLYACQEERN